MPLNRACVGKSYPSVSVSVTRAAIESYARACNETNPRYFDAAAPGGIVAPPLYAAVATWTPLIHAITDPELSVDLLRLLHNVQEMDFVAPIRPEDSITSRSTVAAIESVASGETLTIELNAHNQRGQEVNRTRFTVFIRGRRGAGVSARERESAIGETHSEPLFVTAQTIDSDQTVRYAEASGDRNPIHLDPKIAAMAGLPNIIVHGLCTMAFAARGIIDGLCGSAPTRLRRMVAHFARPVFPGDTITTAAWLGSEADGLRAYRYVTRNPAGKAVIRDGIAYIARE